MGFFKDFKRDFAQAVNELMPEAGELAGEYDDEDMVNTFDEDDIEIAPEDLLEDLDEVGIDDDELPMEFETFQDEPDREKEESREDEKAEEEDELGSVPEAEIIGDDSDFESEPEDLGGEYAEAVLLSAETAQEEEPAVHPEAELPEEPEKTPEKPAEEDQPEELQEDISEPEDEPEEETEPEEPALETIDPMEAARNVVQQEEIPVAPDEAEEEVKKMESVAEEKSRDIDSIMTDDTTYITKGTRIKGDMVTDGGIDVIGTVEGSVTCQGKLICGGTIKGEVKAGELYANAAKIEGNVNTEGSVKIGVGSVVIGNIVATSAVVAGAVNGDIDVQGPVIVDSTAVVMGNIKSRSVQINNGAVIEGFCSQCYSEIDVKSFFA